MQGLYIFLDPSAQKKFETCQVIMMYIPGIVLSHSQQPSRQSHPCYVKQPHAYPKGRPYSVRQPFWDVYKSSKYSRVTSSLRVCPKCPGPGLSWDLSQKRTVIWWPGGPSGRMLTLEGRLLTFFPSSSFSLNNKLYFESGSVQWCWQPVFTPFLGIPFICADDRLIAPHLLTWDTRIFLDTITCILLSHYSFHFVGKTAPHLNFFLELNDLSIHKISFNSISLPISTWSG